MRDAGYAICEVGQQPAEILRCCHASCSLPPCAFPGADCPPPLAETLAGTTGGGAAAWGTNGGGAAGCGTTGCGAGCGAAGTAVDGAAAAGCAGCGAG